MKLKKFIPLFLICALLTGCWDKVEIDKKELVSIIGIDVGEDIGKEKELKNAKSDEPLNSIDLKKLHLTLGAPDISKLGPDKGGAAEDKYIDVDAYSVQDALSKAALKSSRSIRFSHTKLLVLSEELMEYPEIAKEVIDYLQREPSLNRNMYVILSEGKCDQYVKFKTTLEKNIENYILGLVESDAKSSEILPVTLNDFLVDMSQNGNTIIPRISMDKDNKEIEISGVGVIKDYKIKGKLNPSETANLELLRGTLKGGKKMINIDNHPLDIRIDDIRRKLKVSVSNDKLRFDINLVIEGQIKNYYTTKEILSVDKLSYVEKNFNKSIKQECEQLVKIVQRDLEVDPIGLREYIEKYHPGTWKKVKDNWEDEYKNAIVNVNVDTKIRRIGVVK